MTTNLYLKDRRALLQLHLLGFDLIVAAEVHFLDLGHQDFLILSTSTIDALFVWLHIVDLHRMNQVYLFGGE